LAERSMVTISSNPLAPARRFYPDTDAVYLIPIEDVGPHTSAYLRVEPARNNQTKGVRWAVDYEVVPKSD
jgi:hypothetical protein